jgi:hypothetical protein
VRLKGAWRCRGELVEKMTRRSPSMFVAHADWGADPRKQWVAVARRNHRGRWSAFAPTALGNSGSLRHRLHADDLTGTAVLGFDFPIGLPRAYADRAGVSDFTTFLRSCGEGDWDELFDVADAPHEITLRRPFYPRTYLPKGAKKREHLTSALELEYDALLRRCERARPGRGAACSLFWTCGGNQVGKGALAGWRLLRAEPASTRFWPFDGSLDALVSSGGTIVTETYPAEFTHHVGLGRVVGKRRHDVRRIHAGALLDCASGLDIELDPSLENRVRDGFGPAASGEDQFDAFIGLLGMVNVLEQRREPGDPADDRSVQTVEGWILGQHAI